MKLAMRMLCLALVTSVATAQDSVSKYQALPGDAINAHDPADQINDYVLDLDPFESSWRKDYQVGILIKSSLENDFSPVFFNNLISAHAMSNTSHDGPFLRNSYGLWSVQGQGVSADPGANDPPAMNVNTSNLMGRQFGAAFTEFGGNNNNVITAIANYETTNPQRLYVSRIVTATNSPDFVCNLSQFGFGGVDSHGNTVFRADDFGASDCSSPVIAAIMGNNVFNVAAAARTGTNVLSLDNTMPPADTGATGWVQRASGTVYNTPTVLPQAVNGTRGVAIGANFNSEYVYESVAGGNPLMVTSAHRPTPDQRGGVSFSHKVTALGGVGACAMIGRDAASMTTSVFAWGVTANGTPTASVLAPLPVSITDNDDGASFGAGAMECNAYESQTAFRGGNGQVALGTDQQNRLLLAAGIDHPLSSGSFHPDNLVGVARVTAAGVDWTVAGHATGINNGMVPPATAVGKEIFDDAGAVIGQMVTYEAALGLPYGSDPRPSVSPPSMDSVGNIYFLSFVQIYGTGPMGTDDFGVALLRANYDATNFSYRLEKIFEGGDVFDGLNSGTPWQIQFLSVVDSNSVNSSTHFSGNINQDAYKGLASANLDPDDSRTLGGLVINANIVYDVDGDGDYDSFLNGTGSPDEDYQALLYISGLADCNDNGVDDDVDIASGSSPDINGNGVPDECDPALTVPFCPGVNCPCGNDDPTAGCLHSSGSGSLLAGVGGTTSFAADNLRLDATCPPGNSGLILVNNVGDPPLALFDGLNCVRGGPRVAPGADGGMPYPFGDVDLVANDGVRNFGDDTGVNLGFYGIVNLTFPGYISPGNSYAAQYWFRDVLCGPPPAPCPSPCGLNANFSNGVTFLVTP